MAGNQELLASVPLFAKLNRKTLDRLDRILVEREFPAGKDIVTEGDVGAGFFLIKEGSVDIMRGDTKLDTSKKGDFFGDMALLDGHPRSASVRANETTTCLVMTRWDFMAEVRSNPDIAIELLEHLSMIIRELQHRVNS
jgi:CRP/FNR family transcriptional regulator, cyclic AMP receptor protein